MRSLPKLKIQLLLPRDKNYNKIANNVRYTLIFLLKSILLFGKLK